MAKQICRDQFMLPNTYMSKTVEIHQTDLNKRQKSRYKYTLIMFLTLTIICQTDITRRKHSGGKKNC